MRQCEVVFVNVFRMGDVITFMCDFECSVERDKWMWKMGEGTVAGTHSPGVGSHTDEEEGR